MRLAYQAYRWLWESLNWFYPPSCCACKKPGERWCSDCQAAVALVSSNICADCGAPLTSSADRCPRCLTATPAFIKLRSWAIFEGSLRTAIHNLKYGQDVALGELLSRPLIHMAQGLLWPGDLILPVPTGKNHLKQRGYNQAALLARPLALAMGKRYLPAALYRQREIRPQVGLSAQERRENVVGAFAARPNMVRNQVVWVVDDVTTTGSTLQACAEALMDAGAQGVYALTLARAA